MQTAAEPVSGYPSPLFDIADNSVSAVSWPAIAAGVVVAAAKTAPSDITIDPDDVDTADSARRHAEAASTFSALAMLVGAFIACIAAALGGHRRDVHD